MVGDNGLGYEDVGEECDWGENTYEEDADDSPPARKGGKKGAKAPAGSTVHSPHSHHHVCIGPGDKKRPAEPKPDTRRTMQRMFAAAKASAPAPAKPAAVPVGDDLLADILGGLDDAPSSTSIKPPARAKRYAHVV